MLDLNRLVALREVKLHGSLTAAAASMKITVSAVSQQITKLEQELGISLLEPLGRGVQLTPAAGTLISATEDALYALERAEAEVRSRSTAERTLRVATFSSFHLNLLLPMLAQLNDESPFLHIETVQLDPAEAVCEVSSRRADLALVDEYPGFPLKPSPALVKQQIASDPFEVYFPKGAACRTPAQALRTAAELPWALEGSRTESGQWARSICRNLGFEPRVMFVSPDFHFHAKLVASGRAASFLPRSVSRFCDTLGQRPAGFPRKLARTISAVVRRGAQHRSDIETVVAAIAAQYRLITGG